MADIFKGKIIKEGNVVLFVVPAQKLIEMNTQLLKGYITEKNMVWFM